MSIAITGPAGGTARYCGYLSPNAASAVARSSSLATTRASPRGADPPQLPPVVVVPVHNELDDGVRRDVVEPLETPLAFRLNVDHPIRHEPTPTFDDGEDERNDVR